MTSPKPGDPKDDENPPKLELYLTGSSSKSKLTEIKLRRLLDQELQDGYLLETVDVLAQPGRADRANVLLTPTLIKMEPGSTRRLVGSLDQREQILWLLGEGGERTISPKRNDEIDLEGQALIDLCPFGIVLVDIHGEIMTSNVAGLRILGLEGQSLDGQVIGLPLSTEMATDLAQVGGKPIEFSVVERQWNGSAAYLITLRSLLHLTEPAEETSPSGQPSQSGDTIRKTAGDRLDELRNVNAALTRTIGESMKTMEALRATRDELERSNEELQTFAHRVAHDVKAPLRNIGRSIEIVLEDEAERLAKESKDLLSLSTRSIQRLQALLDSLLTFAKVGSQGHEFTEVDLNSVLKWVHSDLEPTIKAAFGVCDIGPLPKVIGNASELYQLFLNLVGNAIKYRRPNVPPIVTVTAKSDDERQSDGAETIHITVSDNGIGFDSADAGRIFEPFTRLIERRDIEGSGIGLATAKKIVGRHGGAISASGKVGEGSTFTFDLRCKPETA